MATYYAIGIYKSDGTVVDGDDLLQATDITSGVITPGTGNIDFDALGLENAVDITDGVQVTDDLGTGLGTLEAATVDNPAAALELGNATYGVTVPGDATFSGAVKLKTGAQASGMNLSNDGASTLYYNNNEGGKHIFQGTGSDILKVAGNSEVTGDATFSGAVDIGTLTTLGPYTFATLPSASASSGATLRITDRAQKQAYSDGANWLFTHDNATVT